MKSRTFLLTLLLFLLFFNSGILIISTITLKSNLANYKERGLNEHYFIASSFVKDLHALEERGIPHEEAVGSLYLSYYDFYDKQKITITIAMDGEQLFSDINDNFFRSSDVSNLEETERRLQIIKLKDKEYVMVEGALPAPYNEYTITYYYDVTSMIHSWNRMTMMLFVAGMFFCGLLAVCLFFVLNRIFKPLQEIADVSTNIAQGQYTERIAMKGNDELTEMATAYNHMADEIQNKIQQLTEASRQKQQFIDNLAHELRTPLTSIYGYADYIQKVVRTEEDKLFATNLIMSESRRLQNIANRLLYMATSRENSIEREHVHMQDLFSEIKQSMSIKAEEKNIKVSYDYHFETLYCEADMIHILLVNLVDNAIKACGKDGEVKVTAFLADGEQVISVQDNGCGMTEDQLMFITEPFYRVDGSRSRSIGGAGLGLSLCEQIVESHGAKLHFITEEGNGTIVKINFTTS